MEFWKKIFSKNQRIDPKVVLDAVKNGDLNQVQSFFKNGIDINATYKIDEDNFGNTLLMVAAFFGQTELVRVFINAKCDINATDNKGSSALMLAALNGHVEIVELLLSAEADTNIKYKGVTAMMLAELKGHNRIVNLIKQYEKKQYFSDLLSTMAKELRRAKDADEGSILPQNFINVFHKNREKFLNMDIASFDLLCKEIKNSDNEIINVALTGIIHFLERPDIKNLSEENINGIIIEIGSLPYDPIYSDRAMGALKGFYKNGYDISSLPASLQKEIRK